MAHLRDHRASQQDGTYPRPQLLREAWASLDRQVGFAHDDSDVGLGERWHHDPSRFDRVIQLPFAPESRDSGIGETGFHPVVWYRIELDAADLAAAGHAPGRRLLLHIGALDHEATVWLDGVQVGTHVGGQAAFTLDLTDALDPDAATHALVVRAVDDPQDVHLPRGKQDWLESPHTIWYHRTTGIWRSVWLESVPAVHIERITWRSDVPAGRVTALVELNRRPASGTRLDLALGFEGQAIASQGVEVDNRLVEVVVALPGQRNGVNFEQLLWQPGHPALVDAALVLSAPGQDADIVTSYLGVRDIAVGAHHLLVNFRPTIVRAVLEQAFWPSSGFTPPSLEAMRAEVQLVLDLGFNCARIHQTVADPRMVFWADRLGLMLWGETAAAYAFDARAVALLTAEWVELVRQYASHPSIVAWVPFNESWGITFMSREPAQQAYSRALSDLTRALDPTRPVVSNDGWEHTDSDLFTIHDYEWRREVLEQRYTVDGVRALVDGLGPAGRELVVGEHQRPGLPVILSEFGGVEFVTTPSADQTWGYSSAIDAADYERRVREIMTPVKASPVLGGYCWTQLTDTLQEANGLCDENRVPKLPLETLRELMGEGGELTITASPAS